MQYFIIFFGILILGFFLWKSLYLHRHFKKKLREAIISKLAQKKNNFEFFSNYVFCYAADIILKAPRSTRQNLLKSFFLNNQAPLLKYIKTKDKTLCDILNGKFFPQTKLENQNVFGLFMAGWYFWETGSPQNVAKILKKLPKVGLSEFEKNLKKLFWAGQYLHQTDLKKAVQKANAAALWFHREKFFEEEAQADLFLSGVFQMSGFQDTAKLYMMHAKKLYKVCGSERGLAKIKALEGTEYLFAQDFERAEKYLNKALQAAHKNKQSVLECQILTQLVCVYDALENKAKSTRLAKKVCQKVQKTKDRDLQKRLKNKIKKYL